MLLLIVTTATGVCKKSLLQQPTTAETVAAIDSDEQGRSVCFTKTGIVAVVLGCLWIILFSPILWLLCDNCSLFVVLAADAGVVGK